MFFGRAIVVSDPYTLYNIYNKLFWLYIPTYLLSLKSQDFYELSFFTTSAVVAFSPTTAERQEFNVAAESGWPSGTSPGSEGRGLWDHI